MDKLSQDRQMIVNGLRKHFSDRYSNGKFILGTINGNLIDNFYFSVSPDSDRLYSVIFGKDDVKFELRSIDPSIEGTRDFIERVIETNDSGVFFGKNMQSPAKRTCYVTPLTTGNYRITHMDLSKPNMSYVELDGRGLLDVAEAVYTE